MADMDLRPLIDLLKVVEGLRLRAYKCPAGVWTIGFGNTRYPDGKAVKKGDQITLKQAEEYLLNDIRKERLPAVRRCVKVPLNNSELCALLSFCYNIGVGAFAKCQLVKSLNAGAPRRDVAKLFMNWTRGGGRVLPGLVKRRKLEIALFLKPDVPVNRT